MPPNSATASIAMTPKQIIMSNGDVYVLRTAVKPGNRDISRAH